MEPGVCPDLCQEPHWGGQEEAGVPRGLKTVQRQAEGRSRQAQWRSGGHPQLFSQNVESPETGMNAGRRQECPPHGGSVAEWWSVEKPHQTGRPACLENPGPSFTQSTPETGKLRAQGCIVEGRAWYEW